MIADPNELYHYNFGGNGDIKCKHPVKIVNGTVQYPDVILAADGNMYQRIVLDPNNSGGRGQCDSCALNSRRTDMDLCPPTSGCSPNKTIACYFKDDNKDWPRLHLFQEKTTSHIHWVPYLPNPIVNKIDVIEVEI